MAAMHCLAATDNYAFDWQKGNSFYQQRQYDSAAWYYEQISAAKPGNAEVYYNLGNTYYRLNKINYAVLNYERALRLNPDYAEAKDNLLLAQSRITNHIQSAGDIFFISWWQATTHGRKATGCNRWYYKSALVFWLEYVGDRNALRLHHVVPRDLCLGT